MVGVVIAVFWRVEAKPGLSMVLLDAIDGKQERCQVVDPAKPG